MKHHDNNNVHRTRTGKLLSMLVLLFPLACSFFAGIPDASAAGGDIQWQRQDDQAGKQEARRSAVDSAGNVIVTGYRNLAGGTDDDFWTVKFKADGSGIAWRAVFDKSGDSDQVNAIVVDTDDNIIVTGHVMSGANRDLHTVKYDGTTGTVLWQHTYAGAAGGMDSGLAVTIDETGDVFVAGFTQNSSGNLDYLVLRYPGDGPTDNVPDWSAVYDGNSSGDDKAESIAAAGGKAAVTGKSWNGSNYDMVTIRYDLVAATSWEKRYATSASAGSKDDAGKEVRFDQSGNVVITGVTANSLDKDIYTAKYAASSGDLIWEKVFNGAYDDEPAGMAIESNGTTEAVYVTGYTWTLDAKHDIYTVKYTDPVEPQTTVPVVAWEKNFNSYNGNDDIASATGIVVDESGDVFVTGYTITATNNDSYQTVKYRKSDGTELWQVSLDVSTGRNDRTIGIGLDPTGNVLVAGWTDSATTGYDYHVVRYDPDLLNPPTGLQAVINNDNSVTLTWDYLHSIETGFVVQRCAGWECTAFADLLVEPLPVGTVTYTDTTVADDSYYYYRVKAISTNNASHYSNTARALTQYISVTTSPTRYDFNSSYDGDDKVISIAAGPDKHPVITGYSDSKDIGGFDYLTMKFDRASFPLPLWDHRYDSMQNQIDMPACITVNTSNEVLVSGNSELYYAPAGGNINSIFTVKYPPTGGEFTWGDQFNGTGGLDDRATSIASSLDVNNNIAVVGYGKNAQNNDDIYLIKYLTDGTRAWTPVVINKGDDDRPAAVGFDKNGDIFLAGTTHNGTDYDIYAAKYNGATGALIWEDTYNGGSGDDQALAMVIDADGNPYMTGYVTGSAGRDFYTIKYDGANSSAQRRTWQLSYNGPADGDDQAAAISVDPIESTTLVVAGTRLTRTGDEDFHIIKYTTGGTEVWSKTIMRPETSDQLNAMATDLSGNIAVAGVTTDWTTTSALSFRIDGNGNILGGMTVAGPGGTIAEATAVAVNRFGEAFVGGYSENAALNMDYLVFRMPGESLQRPYPAAATPATSTVTLSWSDNSLAEDVDDGYQIYRKDEACSASTLSFVSIATLPADQTSYADNTVTASTSYCYRIDTVAGTAVLSSPLVPALTTPVKPDPLTLTPNATQTEITLSWGNVAGETGYTVERKVGTAGTWSVLTTKAADQTIHTDTGLTSSTVYYYRVKATNASGDSLYTDIQSLPARPAALTATVANEAQINLSWADLETETLFILERKTGAGGTYAQIGGDRPQNSISYNDNNGTGLLSGTTYYYRLKARNGSGDSAYAPEVAATTLLRTPHSFTATGTSTTTVALTWADNNVAPDGNETGYQASYALCTNTDPNSCTDPNGVYWGGWTTFPQFAANSTSGTITGLTAGRTYKVRIQGLLSGANSAYSTPNVLSIPTTYLPALATPTAPEIANTSVRLAWTDIAGETNYDILKDGVALNLAIAKNTTTYTVTNLTPNTSYTFQVKGYNSLNASTSTGVVVKTTVDPTTLTAVTPLSQTEIRLVWTDVTVETGYEIQRATLVNQDENPASPPSGWGAWATLNPPGLLAPDTTEYNDTGRTAGNSYKYRVRFKLADSTYSAYSNEVYATTIPAAPATLSSVNGNFTWNNIPGESGYRIYQKQRAGADCATEDWTGVPVIHTAAANDTFFTPTGLTAGAAYCYRMEAFNAAGTSPPGAAFTYLQTPASVTISSITQGGFTATWSTVPGNAGYTLQWSLYSSFSPVAGTYAAPTDTTSRVVTGLLSGRQYYFRMQTKWGTSNTSSFSATATPLTIPGTPAPTAAPASTSSITATWSGITGATSFCYQYKQRQTAACTSEDWTGISDICPPSSPPVTISGLTTGAPYCIRVKSRNATGDSPWGGPVTQTTLLATPTLNPLSGITANNVCLSWGAVTANEGYRVERSLDNVTWTTYPGYPLKDATSYCDTTVLAGTLYYFRVSPKNIVGGFSTASNMQSTTTTPAAPATFTATVVSNTRVDLAWSSSLGATKYLLERKEGSGEWGPVIEQATLSHQNTGLKAGTTYTYRVKAWNATGLYSVASIERAVTTLTVGTTEITSLTPETPTRVVVAWQYDGSVCTPATCDLPEGYEVEMKLASGRWARIATVTQPDATSFTDACGLRPARTYFYRVRSFRGAERSPYSSEISVTTLPYASTTCSYGPSESGHPPVVSSAPPTSASQGTAYTYQLVISDSFVDDSFTYTLLTAPQGMSISSSGLIAWTPSYVQMGEYPVLIRVSDIVGNSVEQSFTITVSRVNQPPVISSSPVTTVPVNTPYSYQIVATDANNDSLAFSLSNPPAGMSITQAGLITWTPTTSGNYPIEVQVSDGETTTTQNYLLEVI